MNGNPVGILGVPFDEKSSYLRGAAAAPPIIRESLFSEAYNPYSEKGVMVDKAEIRDFGNLSIDSYETIEPQVRQILQKSVRLLSFGGDHSIVYPLIKAYTAYYGKVHILQIDAHGDLYDEFEGDRYSHACPFARIMEAGLAHSLTQVGIRSLTPHQRQQAVRFGVEVIEMRDYVLKKIPSLEGPLYLSLDLDGLDPAYAPGVSHQEAGGFTSRQVIDIIQQLPLPLIGADIVELNPTRDIGGITAALAGKLAREILANMIGG
ncbi:MAG: agmatinase [Bacteroidota bacterium]